MAEPNETPVEGQTPPEEQEVETEAAALAVDDGKGNRMVPLSALIGAKKELKALGKKVKELEPIAQRATEIDQKLEQVSPYIQAITTNPKLRAEALRIAQGTHKTAEHAEQPAPDEDPDAAAFAEDMGFYLADGQTPDVARARRALSRMDQRNLRQVDERLRPIAGSVLGSRAEANINALMQMRDDEGAPYATEESLREVIGWMGADAHTMLANPKSVELVLRAAIGEDRMRGRKPRVPDEPIYLASQGGGRRREAAVDPALKASAERLGLSDKDLESAGRQLSSGRAFVLGKD